MATFKFQSKLISISDELEYYAIPVPAKTTEALGTKKAVPVSAVVNGSKPFLISLYPIGEGQHQMRVKASVRKEVGLKEGDKVRVEITLRDHAKEVSVPKDLLVALKSENVLDGWKAIPAGARSFMLRKMDEASKPETRAKRIQAAVEEAHKRKER